MRVTKAKFKVFKCEMLHSVLFCLVFDQQPKKGGETTLESFFQKIIFIFVQSNYVTEIQLIKQIFL